jgi:YYY domain-containing protein
VDTLTDALIWYLVLMAVSWGVAPLVALLCRALPDRGAGIARPIGLITLILPTWWLASIDVVPYTTVGLWVTLIVVAIVGYALAFRAGALDRRWLMSMLVAELIGIAAFALYVWFRGYQPAIVWTEKPMDSLMLASSIRTEQIPPPDPWFAGEPINYYYLGYLINGAVARMAGVAEGVAFNLALAGTFAASVAAASSVGFNLVRRFASLWRAVAAGMIAVALVVWGGNTKSWVDFLRDPSASLDQSWWLGIGWYSSRVIDDHVDSNPIDEFPSFSFVLGDLHPHVMALPFALMALGLAVNLLLGTLPTGWLLRRSETADLLEEPRASVTERRTPWVVIGVTGVLVGSLYALNSWDLPTYGLVAAIAVGVALRQRPVRERLLGVVLLGAAALVAWLPFYVAFSPPVGSGASDLPGWLANVPFLSTLLRTVAPVTGERTGFGEYLLIFAIPTVIAVAFLAVSLLSPGPRRHEGHRSTELLVALAALVVLTLLAQTPVPLVAGLIVTAALEVIRREAAVSVRTIAAGLYAVGYLLTIGTELFYIRDVFGNRMNTIFKIHYQVWLLIGIASALAVVTIWADARRFPLASRRAVRPLLSAAVVAAVGLTSIYPIVSGQRYSQVWEDRGWTSLDGQAFASRAFPDEMAGIDWLQSNAPRDSRVLEAAGCSYGDLDRVPANPVSAYTGFPTVIGWQNHEGQWRNGVEPFDSEIGPRVAEVANLYADPAAAMDSPYAIDYVFVGIGERDGFRFDNKRCSQSGPYDIDDAAFVAAGWQPVFQQGDVVIYGRPGAG